MMFVAFSLLFHQFLLRIKKHALPNELFWDPRFGARSYMITITKWYRWEGINCSKKLRLLYTRDSQPGVCIPSSSQGVHKQIVGSKQLSNLREKSPFWYFLSLKFAIFLFGGTICVKFLFRGTQRGFNMIWGYASTKRLRTPALHDSKNPSKNNSCSNFVYCYHSLKVNRFILAHSYHVKQLLLFIDLDQKVYKLIEE